MVHADFNTLQPRTVADSARHNAAIIRKMVRGKSKAERKLVYEQLALGPFYPIRALIDKMTAEVK